LQLVVSKRIDAEDKGVAKMDTPSGIQSLKNAKYVFDDDKGVEKIDTLGEK